MVPWIGLQYLIFAFFGPNDLFVLGEGHGYFGAIFNFTARF